MKKIILSLALAGLTGPVQAGDVERGRNISATCSACHGFNGISPIDEWPNLAGQKKGYLVKSMKDYRDGGRRDPVMSGMAAGLSDQDIRDLATYYSSLPGK